MEFKTWKVKTCTVYSLKDYIDVIANLKEDFKRIFNNDYGFDTNVNEEELNQKIIFFYRGLYDESYDLKPSCVRGSNYSREKYYYDNIKVLCSNYFPYKSHLNDLVIMQPKVYI